MLKQKFAELQKILLSKCRSYYKSRLVSLVVFGSVARQTMSHDSDVDLLIIADDLPKGRMKRIEEFNYIENKLTHFLSSLEKEGIHTCISPVIKSPQEASIGTPLFFDMVYDAIILYDKDCFFSSILERLRKRLNKLGSRRVYSGNAWYWVLKPDFKPGEVFEI